MKIGETFTVTYEFVRKEKRDKKTYYDCFIANPRTQYVISFPEQMLIALGLVKKGESHE